ncbi:MAG: DUF2795 domain-containing protein [Acetobacteraceae bacterium]|nr:DUF2795 domain-containing protein [Acetobacteraceae bacterium]MBV8592474.1 DUF2795 domain-containing protein [Acetobacteraceae bacterium]
MSGSLWHSSWAVDGVEQRKGTKMTRGLGGQSPANVTHHLNGIDFPAKKQDLIKHAKRSMHHRKLWRGLRQCRKIRMKSYGRARVVDEEVRELGRGHRGWQSHALGASADAGILMARGACRSVSEMIRALVIEHDIFRWRV